MDTGDLNAQRPIGAAFDAATRCTEALVGLVLGGRLGQNALPLASHDDSVKDGVKKRQKVQMVGFYRLQ
jgi:hypothetical protein